MKLNKNGFIYKGNNLQGLQSSKGFQYWNLIDIINYVENKCKTDPNIYILAKNKIDRYMLKYQLGKHNFEWAGSGNKPLDKSYGCDSRVVYYRILHNKIKFGDGVVLWDANNVNDVLIRQAIVFIYRYSKNELY